MRESKEQRTKDGRQKGKHSFPWGVQSSSLWHRWGRLSLGVIFSAGVIAWLASTLDLYQVLFALGQANYSWVGLSILAVLLTLWARVLRWQVLLDSNVVNPSGTLQALVLGQLLNLILPARLGDLGRAYLVTQKGYPSQAQALGTVALEKLWDIILLLGLVVGLAFWQTLPSWVAVPAHLTGISGGVLLAGIVLLLLFRRTLTSKWFHLGRWAETAPLPYSKGFLWLGRITGRLADGLEGLRRPRVILAAGNWSLFAWFFGALTNLALLKAFGLPFSMGIALFLLAVLQMGVAVPSVPGRIGVFEGLCLVTLAIFGIETNTALAYGVMLHAVVLLPPVILGLWWLLRLDLASRQTIWKLT